MKTLTERSAKILAIKHLLSSSAKSFEGYEAGQELRHRFLERSEALNQHLNQLVVPFKATYIDRVESRAAYLEHLHALIGMGMMIASRENNSAQLLEFKSYNHRIKEASAVRILAIGQAVEQFVLQNSDTLSALGVSKKKQQQLGILKKQFEQAIKLATNTAGDRRNLNREIRQLIKECNHMLRWELDIYLKFNAANFPLLYAQYDYLRKPKRRQKPKETAMPAHQDFSTAPPQTKALPEKDRQSPAILLSDTNLLTKVADSRQKPLGETGEYFKPPRELRPDLFSWQNLN